MIRVIGIVIFSLVTVYFSFSFYLNLTPNQRKDLASDWLEAGKAFENSGKHKKAIASYKHAVNLYPFGESGKEAQRILKEKYKITLEFSKSSFEKQNISLAKKYEKLNYKYSVNAYLMAYDVSGNPEYLYKASVILFDNNQKEKAKALAQEAIKNGLDPKNVNPEIIK